MESQLGSVAAILIDSYLDTASYSRQFTDEFGQPPTLLSKVHYLRSVAQARITQDARFILSEGYAEFGRVEITDVLDGTSYLLRSDGAATIERSKQKETLFDSSAYIASPVRVLVYRFHRQGLDLSVAGAIRRLGRSRLEVTGPATYVGTWPYSPDSTEPFDQATDDAFPELGDLNEDEGLEEDGTE